MITPWLEFWRATGRRRLQQEPLRGAFIETRAPAASEVAEVARHGHERVLRMMRCRGLLRDDDDDHDAREHRS
jgi:hypothetical protein